MAGSDDVEVDTEEPVGDPDDVPDWLDADAPATGLDDPFDGPDESPSVDADADADEDAAPSGASEDETLSAADDLDVDELFADADTPPDAAPDTHDDAHDDALTSFEPVPSPDDDPPTPDPDATGGDGDDERVHGDDRGTVDVSVPSIDTSPLEGLNSTADDDASPATRDAANQHGPTTDGDPLPTASVSTGEFEWVDGLEQSDDEETFTAVAETTDENPDTVLDDYLVTPDEDPDRTDGERVASARSGTGSRDRTAARTPHGRSRRTTATSPGRNGGSDATDDSTDTDGVVSPSDVSLPDGVGSSAGADGPESADAAEASRASDQAQTGPDDSGTLETEASAEAADTDDAAGGLLAWLRSLFGPE